MDFMPVTSGIYSGLPQQSFWDQVQRTLAESERVGMDPWGLSYAQRFNPGLSQQLGVPFYGQDPDTPRDVEHFLYAKDTASRGPLGFAQMALGTPAHALLKATGLKSGDTSLEEVWRGWQGAGAGLVDWMRR